jgi:hypothetical protein
MSNAMFPISLPKLSADGRDGLTFASAEESYPDFYEEIEVGDVFNGY